MMYQALDGHQCETRKEIRQYCKSNGMNKNLKSNYSPIAQNTNDQASIKHKKEVEKAMKQVKKNKK